MLKKQTEGENKVKKTFAVMLTVLMLAGLCACGKTAGTEINCKTSEIYSETEIKAAAAAVKAKFLTFEGCTLYSLTYAGDEESEGCLDYCRELKPEKNFDRCIVFESSFRSPKNGGGTWEKNSEYTWTWYVAKGSLGGWQVVNYGYG